MDDLDKIINYVNKEKFECGWQMHEHVNVEYLLEFIAKIKAGEDIDEAEDDE